MAKLKTSRFGEFVAQAERLAADPALYSAFVAADQDRKLRDIALQAPAKLLAQHDVKLPDGLDPSVQGRPLDRQ